MAPRADPLSLANRPAQPRALVNLVSRDGLVCVIPMGMALNFLLLLRTCSLCAREEMPRLML